MKFCLDSSGFWQVRRVNEVNPARPRERNHAFALCQESKTTPSPAPFLEKASSGAFFVGQARVRTAFSLLSKGFYLSRNFTYN